MIRGGSWNNDPQNARVANRNNNGPTNRNHNLGFRLANTGNAAWNRVLHGRRGCGTFCPVGWSCIPVPSIGIEYTTARYGW